MAIRCDYVAFQEHCFYCYRRSYLYVLMPLDFSTEGAKSATFATAYNEIAEWLLITCYWLVQPSQIFIWESVWNSIGSAVLKGVRAIDWIF